MAVEDFPVESFKDAAKHLRRPFSPSAVKWKVQTGDGSKGGGIVVGYIDARLVSERLNLVVPHLWSTSYETYGDRVDTNTVICHLTVDGLTRSDVGKGQGNDLVKAAYSDAFKRAAVHFGIGTSLYAMKAPWVKATGEGETDSHGNPTLRIKKRGQKSTLEITPQVDTWLREGYEKWLATDKGKTFGEPLDHGDVEGSAGVLIEGGPAVTDEPVQDDLALAAKRQEIEEAYASLNGTSHRKFPRGRFTAHLKAADTPEDLDKLAARIKELADA